ncbi:MAG: N-acetyltransferase family protein [Acidimicrobiia bacterium]
MKIRPLVTADWEEVARIYQQGIETGNATFEVDPPTWPDWDASHLRAGRLVAEIAGEVVGWVALSPVSRRHVYRGVAEPSIYVATEARGRGVGVELMTAMVEASESAGIWMLQTAIFPENTVSISLHERFGFRVVGTRERIGKHRDRWRDTWLLERRSETVGL